jgi:hypothetical protein
MVVDVREGGRGERGREWGGGRGEKAAVERYEEDESGGIKMTPGE